MADLRVHILDCGACGMDKDWVSGTLETRATWSNRNLPATWYRAPVLAILVEHSSGNVLFDTGEPRDWEERWGAVGLAENSPYEFVEEHQYLDSRLSQLNLKPEDIDYVVLSHLHYDHAGNANLFDNSSTRILVHKDEKEAGLAFEGDFAYGNVKMDYANLVLEEIAGDMELLPGIGLLEVPGHSPGTLAMTVELEHDQNLVFTSDAIFMRENIGPPHSCGLSITDHAQWAQSVDKLLTYSAEQNAMLVFGHDSEQAKELKLAPEGFYW